MTRVFVVDDHAVVRAGLRTLLGDAGIDVVGEAPDAETALRRLRGLDPDVLVVDVNLPGGSGIDALPDLLAAAPRARALVLSIHDHPRYARQAFAAGAAGFVVKDAPEGELVAGIEEVGAGGRYVSSTLGARLVEDEAARPKRPLSKREQEVVALVARGLSNREVAERLWLSPRTVENDRLRAMRKLGLGTRAELVSYALDQGLL